MMTSSNSKTYHIRTEQAIPELMRVLPTLPLTRGIYFGRRAYWTVASLVVLLREGIERMPIGDLDRLIELGELAKSVKENNDQKTTSAHQ